LRDCKANRKPGLLAVGRFMGVVPDTIAQSRV
jgi:hypothetical protein